MSDTTPPPPVPGPTEPPPVDIGNHLLAPGPAAITVKKWQLTLDTGPTDTVLLTIRTQSTTISVWVRPEDARKIAAELVAEADKCSSLVVAPAGLRLPPMQDLRSFVPGKN